jgi:hypothetical protein
MRHLGIDDYQMMRLARDRAAEIRSDWLQANGPRSTGGSTTRTAGRVGLVARIRVAAGLRLIGGTGVAPRRSEPCV